MSETVFVVRVHDFHSARHSFSVIIGVANSLESAKLVAAKYVKKDWRLWGPPRTGRGELYGELYRHLEDWIDATEFEVHSGEEVERAVGIDRRGRTN